MAVGFERSVMSLQKGVVRSAGWDSSHRRAPRLWFSGRPEDQADKHKLRWVLNWAIKATAIARILPIKISS